MNVKSRIPPDAEDGVPALRSDPTDPPFVGAVARKPHTDEEYDYRRDEELLDRHRGPIPDGYYSWA